MSCYFYDQTTALVPCARAGCDAMYHPKDVNSVSPGKLCFKEVNGHFAMICTSCGKKCYVDSMYAERRKALRLGNAKFVRLYERTAKVGDEDVSESV